MLGKKVQNFRHVFGVKYDSKGRLWAPLKFLSVKSANNLCSQQHIRFVFERLLTDWPYNKNESYQTDRFGE